MGGLTLHQPIQGVGIVLPSLPILVDRGHGQGLPTQAALRHVRDKRSSVVLIRCVHHAALDPAAPVRAVAGVGDLAHLGHAVAVAEVADLVHVDPYARVGHQVVEGLQLTLPVGGGVGGEEVREVGVAYSDRA